ncbi:MAG: Gfo/Idh/MocA family oxidoreductase [Planctomycetota bacterium]|nr:Gfo/Idh/MocA family oxidoreductase [Planctomycetota bacterium]
MEEEGIDVEELREGFAGLRIAVIGARRARNGTGPFLARQATQLGAKLVAVVGTRPESARLAAEELAAEGVRVAAFTEADDLFAEAAPNVVLIASPSSTHRPWLHVALEAHAHVLCEKPLNAGGTAETGGLVQEFAAAGLVLAENCQWPFTMPAFLELHPGFELPRAKAFRMLMAPQQRGLERWSEVLSHPLSLLQAVAPGPAELSAIRFAERDPEAADARLDFRFKTHEVDWACEVVAEDLGLVPRPAEYAFDEALCRRRVSPKDYRIRFEAQVPAPGKRSRAAQIGDPMQACLEDFLLRVVRANRSLSAPMDEALVRRQALLAVLLDAWRAQCGHPR